MYWKNKELSIELDRNMKLRDLLQSELKCVQMEKDGLANANDDLQHQIADASTKSVLTAVEKEKVIQDHRKQLLEQRTMITNLQDALQSGLSKLKEVEDERKRLTIVEHVCCVYFQYL